MSTKPTARFSLGSVIVTVAAWSCLSSCGWRLGPVDVGGLSVAPVQGASLDPGLAAELRQRASIALAERGVVRGGDLLVLQVEEGPERVAGVVPGERAGALSGSLSVRASIPSRPGCEVRAQAERIWGAREGSASATEVDRDERRAELASLLAERLVDEILGSRACRAEP